MPYDFRIVSNFLRISTTGKVLVVEHLMIGHNLKTGLVNVIDCIKRTNRGQMIDSPDFSQLKILVDPNAVIRKLKASFRRRRFTVRNA